MQACCVFCVAGADGSQREDRQRRDEHGTPVEIEKGTPEKACGWGVHDVFLQRSEG